MAPTSCGLRAEDCSSDVASPVTREGGSSAVGLLQRPPIGRGVKRGGVLVGSGQSEVVGCERLAHLNKAIMSNRLMLVMGWSSYRLSTDLTPRNHLVSACHQLHCGVLLKVPSPPSRLLEQPDLAQKHLLLRPYHAYKEGELSARFVRF